MSCRHVEVNLSGFSLALLHEGRLHFSGACGGMEVALFAGTRLWLGMAAGNKPLTLHLSYIDCEERRCEHSGSLDSQPQGLLTSILLLDIVAWVCWLKCIQF